MRDLWKRYRFFAITFVIFGFIVLFYHDYGIMSLKITGNSFREMFILLPPIFLLLGLMDEWVPREMIMKYMGNHSGFVGGFLAFVLGSLAAGPLYAAFPIAGVFMKKGVKYTNILIFIGAWSSTKIPLLILEASSLGISFTITRFIVNILGIISIAYLLNKMVPENQFAHLNQIQSTMGT